MKLRTKRGFTRSISVQVRERMGGKPVLGKGHSKNFTIYGCSVFQAYKYLMKCVKEASQ